jgi:hypothetical protein
MHDTAQPRRNDMSAKIVEKYFDTWNEPDADNRLTLAEETWAPDARYVDPNTDVTGAAGFSQMVAAVHEQYPGYGFRLSSAVETHHDVLRFSWEIVDPSGNVALAGIDVGRVAEDGRLASLLGFFGVTPPNARDEAR